MIAPLPVQQEELVVVQIVDGQADESIVHLPLYPNRFNALDFAPTRWTSACRKVHSGSVYARAGVFADAPVCSVCEAAA